jgi:hypothetical protein
MRDQRQRQTGGHPSAGFRVEAQALPTDRLRRTSTVDDKQPSGARRADRRFARKAAVRLSRQAILLHDPGVARGDISGRRSEAASIRLRAGESGARDRAASTSAFTRER